mgnify:CR=1 FL=1
MKCPKCGSAEKSRVFDDGSMYCGSCGKVSGEPENTKEARIAALEVECARLRDIITRASVCFFHDGTDGETASRMLAILNDANKELSHDK